MPGLLYPGRAFGFDKTHPAARNARFSGVSRGVNFLDILTGRLGTAIGVAPTAGIDAQLGIKTNFGLSSNDGLTFSGKPAIAESNITLAAVVNWTASGSFKYWISNSGASPGYALAFDTTTTFYAVGYGGTSQSVAVTIPLGVPLFVAISSDTSVTTNFFMMRLDTGQVLVDASTAAISTGASNGTYIVGNSPGVNDAPTGAAAAAMGSGVFLSRPQLRDWAARELAGASYWYPQQSRPIYLFSPGAAAAAVLQAEPHFIGRMAVQPIYSMAALRQNQASDASGPLGVQAETNTHFVGKFQPPKMSILQDYRQNRALDIPAVVTIGDPPGMIGGFIAPLMTVLRSLRENQASNFSSSVVQPETNTHFVGRFLPPINWLLRSSRENQASDATSLAPQPETNVHFIGKFALTAIKLLPWLRQNTANDLSTDTLQAETNTHFIGRFTKIPMNLPLTSRQNQANDFFVAPPFDNPTHFVGKFTPQMVSVLRSLRENTANDSSTPVPQADTATHFIGRFVQTSMRVSPDLRQNQATDLASAIKQIFDWLVTARRRGRR